MTLKERNKIAQELAVSTQVKRIVGEWEMVAKRPWSAVYQFPGKKPFYIGTCPLSYELTNEEVITQLDIFFDMFWSQHFPDNFEKPPLVKYVPGAVIFVEV